MANIHETLKDKDNFVVEHLGESAALKLPEWLTKIGLTNRQTIQEYINGLDDDAFLGIWHNNVSKTYIDLRAAARPGVKSFSTAEKRQEEFRKINNPNNHILFETKNKKGETLYKFSKKLSTDLVDAQNRINNYKWAPTPEPQQVKVKSKEELLASLSIEDLKAALAKLQEAGK